MLLNDFAPSFLMGALRCCLGAPEAQARSGPGEAEGIRVAAPRVEVRPVLAVSRGVLGRGVEQAIALGRGGVAVVVEQADAQLLVVRVVARLGRTHREGLEQR